MLIKKKKSPYQTCLYIADEDIEVVPHISNRSCLFVPRGFLLLLTDLFIIGHLPPVHVLVVSDSMMLMVLVCNYKLKKRNLLDAEIPLRHPRSLT